MKRDRAAVKAKLTLERVQLNRCYDQLELFVADIDAGKYRQWLHTEWVQLPEISYPDRTLAACAKWVSETGEHV